MSRQCGRCGRLAVLAPAAGLCFLLLVSSASAQPVSARDRSSIEECVTGAAEHHRVNRAVLLAILRIESGLDPGAVGRNADGSLDVGIAQINSRHFKALAVHGIRPEHLFDACVGAYVAAWRLSTLIAAHGNTWMTLARYHSGTPYFNHRYQLLLANELVRAGVIAGRKVPVPALPRRVAGNVTVAPLGSEPPVLVLDDARERPAR